MPNTQQESINRRRQMAQALQQSAILPIQSQRPDVPIHATQGLAKLAEALFAGLINRKLDKQQSALDTQTEADRQSQFQAIAQSLNRPELAQVLGGEFGSAYLVDALQSKRQKAEEDAQAARLKQQQEFQASERQAGEASEAKRELNRLQMAEMKGLQDFANSAFAASKPIEVSPGASLLSPSGQLIGTAPGPVQPRNIDPLSDEGIAAAVERDKRLNAGKPADERLVQVMGPNGAPIWVRESQAVGKPAAQAARAVTGQERSVLAFYNRGKQASDTITEAGPNGSLEDRIAKQSTAEQYRGKYAPNILQSAEQQSYRQAQRAFTEARLRKESGAAIPANEYENDAKTYFAEPGDDPEIVKQKRAARQTVLDGLAFSAGKAYDEFYGEAYPRPTTTNPAAPTTAPQGVPPEVWAVMTPEEKALWK